MRTDRGGWEVICIVGDKKIRMRNVLTGARNVLKDADGTVKSLYVVQGGAAISAGVRRWIR